MTSTPVTDVSMNLFQVTSNKGTDYAGGTGFDQIMNSSSKKEPAEPYDTKCSQPTKVERKKEDVVREAAKDTNEKPQKDIATDEIRDDATKAAEKIVEKVADELDVSEEEVTKAMEALGLTLSDLFQPENLKTLVTEIAAEGNSIALMTNEDLYTSLQNLIQFANGEMNTLASEQELTVEELETVLDYLKQNENSTESAAATQNMPETGNQQSEAASQLKTGEGIDNHTGSTENTEADDAKVNTAAEALNDHEQQETSDTMGDEQSHNEDNRSNHGEQKNVQVNIGQNAFMNNELNVNGENQIPQETFRSAFSNVDGMDIIRQISDYMNLQNKDNLTQMELQLHPASLGTINLTVTSKAGVITASIETQNEAVKNALETQIITLRENLENQGVKVEAVEVTVASHEFERNLNQGDGKNQTDEEKVGKSAKTRQVRRINLEDESMEEELDGDEEVTLAKEVMKMNGNTVDYTV